LRRGEGSGLAATFRLAGPPALRAVARSAARIRAAGGSR